MRSIDGLLKWYYLVQFAFWLHQILVINLEDRRKDHWQMFTHHIVTSLLLSMSYGFYQTKVGNVILCVMDAVDLVLSVSSSQAELLFECLRLILFAVDRKDAQLRAVSNRV